MTCVPADVVVRQSFIFIHKPTCIIGFDEIESVEFQRYGGAQVRGSR